MKNNRAHYVLLIVSVIAAVYAVYWQSLFLPFIQDDWGMLKLFSTNKPLAILKQVFDIENKLFYRPLANTYLLLMYEIFGSNPTPFHLIALTVHIINSCLVALIVDIVIRDRLISYLTAMIYGAAIAIHLDPLAWAVGIYDVGGAFFFFMSMWLFLSNRPVISATFYFFGCFFKESVVILPILLFSYTLLMRSKMQLTKKTTAITTDWKHTIPFLMCMMVALAIKLSSGISPFYFPAEHPYVIDLAGAHIIKNLLAYLVWMFQSLLPSPSVKVHTYQFFILAVVLALLYGILLALVVFRLRGKHFQSQRIIFLLTWLLVSLMPVLFLPNHTYRYYATYSLPAFVGSMLFLVKHSFLSFDVRQKVIVVVLISISSFAVLDSILQGNQVYREMLTQSTLSDGTNFLIRRAEFVNIVHKGLKRYLPSPPSNSSIVISNADLWSFNKDSGPQFWYNDGTIHVYAYSDLKYADGRPYIDNPIESQAQTYTGPTDKKIFLNSSRLFVYQVSDGKLIRINFQELSQSEMNSKHSE